MHSRLSQARPRWVGHTSGEMRVKGTSAVHSHSIWPVAQSVHFCTKVYRVPWSVQFRRDFSSNDPPPLASLSLTNLKHCWKKSEQGQTAQSDPVPPQPGPNRSSISFLSTDFLTRISASTKSDFILNGIKLLANSMQYANWLTKDEQEIWWTFHFKKAISFTIPATNFSAREPKERADSQG